MYARTSFEKCACSDKQATSWHQSSQDARVHVYGAGCPDGAGPPEPVFSAPGIPKHRQNGLAGPAPSGKPAPYTCTRALLLKHAHVQISKQLPGTNHRKMRAYMYTVQAFRTERAPPSQFSRLPAFQSIARMARRGPLRPESLHRRHARAHFC